MPGLLLAAVVLTGTDGHLQAQISGAAPVSGRFITVEILQDAAIDYAGEVLGLDCPYGCDYLFFVSSADGHVFKAALDGFGQIGGFDLATTNADAFDYSSIQSLPDAQDGYTFDNSEAKFFRYFNGELQFLGWDYTMGSCTGHDNQGSYHAWVSHNYYSSKAVVDYSPWEPSIPPQVYSVTPPVYSRISGLARFECPELGYNPVVLTCFYDHRFFFFGSGEGTLFFYGECDCPVECSRSLGLDYSYQRGTFFWSYEDAAGAFHIAELDIDLGIGLGSATWGSIKTLFD